jgi:hypothetical protein
MMSPTAPKVTGIPESDEKAACRYYNVGNRTRLGFPAENFIEEDAGAMRLSR